ncbi:hypothetical protein, partial [Pyramidobacter piscolens]
GDGVEAQRFSWAVHEFPFFRQMCSLEAFAAGTVSAADKGRGKTGVPALPRPFQKALPSPA